MNSAPASILETIASLKQPKPAAAPAAPAPEENKPNPLLNPTKVHDIVDAIRTEPSFVLITDFFNAAAEIAQGNRAEIIIEAIDQAVFARESRVRDAAQRYLQNAVTAKNASILKTELEVLAGDTDQSLYKKYNASSNSLLLLDVFPLIDILCECDPAITSPVLSAFVIKNVPAVSSFDSPLAKKTLGNVINSNKENYYATLRAAMGLFDDSKPLEHCLKTHRWMTEKNLEAVLTVVTAHKETANPLFDFSLIQHLQRYMTKTESARESAIAGRICTLLANKDPYVQRMLASPSRSLSNIIASLPKPPQPAAD